MNAPGHVVGINRCVHVGQLPAPSGPSASGCGPARTEQAHIGRAFDAGQRSFQTGSIAS
jgi:hypothetical protein